MNKAEMHAWIDSCQEDEGFVPINSHRRKKQRKVSGEGDKCIRVPKSCADGFMATLEMVAAKIGNHSREICIDFAMEIVRRTLELE